MNTSYKKVGQDAENAMSGAADHLTDMARENGRTVQRAVEDATSAAKRKAEDMGDAARDFGANVKDAAEDALEDGKSRLGAVKDAVVSKATEAKDAVVAGAGSTMAAVRDAAVERADGARESLSDVGDRLAATLNRAAEGDDADGLKTKVLGSVAQGLTQASDALRQRSVSELSSDVKEMAKRHPGAFMAAAALVGFAAARFVRSSSQRRMAQNNDGGQGPRV